MNHDDAIGVDDLARLMDAIDFAAHKHRDQRRKDRHASPYINHPLALVRVLVTEGRVTDTTTLVCAVLHDTIEDTQTTREELAERFGEEVAAIVEEVSDDKRLTSQERKQAQIDHAPALSERARLVKLADKICNVRDVISHPPHDWPESRRRKYLDWARDVVNAMGPVSPELRACFDAAVSHPIVHS